MGNDRLDGWKEISRYADRDIRTCQRWEKDLGLPVHRVDNHSLRSKVFSYKSEIDEWFTIGLANKDIEKNFFRRKKDTIFLEPK